MFIKSIKSDLQEKIYESVKLKNNGFDEFRLFFSGKYLEKNELISNTEIKNLSTIDLFVNFNLKKNLQIFVKFFNNKTYCINIENDKTLTNLHQILCERTNLKIPLGNYKFVYKNLTLDLNKKIIDYSIKNEDTIYTKVLFGLNSLKSKKI